MKRAEPGWFLLTLAGLAALLGSFLPFYTFPRGVDVTVWSRGLFPTAALIPVLGVLIGAQALFVLIRGHEPRSPFLNFTWEQVRLGVGAFMILLALSYLLQDRAGGTLGVGYLILSLSSLATFAGGVMTRRVQLARAPGEKPPAREPRPLLKPAVATVSRLGSELGKNVAGVGNNVKDRLASRKEAATTRREAKAEARAAAKAAAAARAEAEAKAAAEAAAAAPPQPPAPTETFDVPPSELPAAAEKIGAPPSPPVSTPDEPDGTPAEEPAAEEPAAEEPAAEEPAAEEPAAEEAKPTEELVAEDAHAPTKELVAEDAEKTEELVVEDPDKTAPPDGAHADQTIEAKDQSEAQEEEKEEESSPST
jgi:hypothetical protein